MPVLRESFNMNLSTIFVSLFWLLTVTWAQVDEEEVRASHQKYAEMMKHDGKKRVKVITQKNVKSMLKKNDILVVFFWVDNDKQLEKLNEQDMYFLEVSLYFLCIFSKFCSVT